ncbi:hypothetical protein WJX74_003599 [Apatococcus lobatus]|uniref:Uncharacterized protein n=1 Tax=Apatococcus lobatus TaxID=904363 RepID=A0AAW1RMY2_9CHLO
MHTRSKKTTGSNSEVPHRTGSDRSTGQDQLGRVRWQKQGGGSACEQRCPNFKARMRNRRNQMMDGCQLQVIVSLFEDRVQDLRQRIQISKMIADRACIFEDLLDGAFKDQEADKPQQIAHGQDLVDHQDFELEFEVFGGYSHCIAWIPTRK